MIRSKEWIGEKTIKKKTIRRINQKKKKNSVPLITTVRKESKKGNKIEKSHIRKANRIVILHEKKKIRMLQTMQEKFKM